MMTIQLEGNDIQKFLDMAKNQFDLTVKVIDNIKLPKKTKRDKLDEQLRSLKTVDVNVGKELKDALTLVGKDVDITEYKTAREEYLNKKYGL